MKFLDWLLGKDWDKPQVKEDPAPKSKSRAELARELEPGLNALFGPEKEEYSPEPKPKKMQRVALMPVPKWTHPGKKGKTIYCPHCNSSTHVYHFAWSKLVCSSCGAETNKYLWLISKDVQ